MRPVERNEILPIGEYETIRPRFRARVIEEKKLRRIKLNDFLSIVFENHDSALMQIQEMLRTERITSEPAIQHEIETYNDLVPGPGQLSATFFVEIAEKEPREQMLVELEGLERTIFLEVEGERFAAKGNFAGVIPGRTTAVHYFKFDLSEAAQAAIRGRSAKVAVVVDHVRSPLRVELARATVVKLAEDLEG
jgi:hypothetical protein